MNFRKTVGIFFLLALLFGGGLWAFGILGPKTQTADYSLPAGGVVLGTPLQVTVPTRKIGDLSELPKGAASHVDVVYFHRTERCTACLNTESYTRETIEKYFANQVGRGVLSFRVLDVEKAENAALARKFDATGSSLYFSVLIEGTEYLCPMTDVWFYATNKYLFVDMMKKNLALVTGGS